MPSTPQAPAQRTPERLKQAPQRTAARLSGVYLGAALSSLSVVLSGKIGWRATSCVAASASAAAATLFAVVWLASPPVPRPTPAAKPPPTRSRDDTGRGVLRELRDVARVPAARLLLGAVTARFFAGYALAA